MKETNTLLWAILMILITNSEKSSWVALLLMVLAMIYQWKGM